MIAPHEIVAVGVAGVAVPLSPYPLEAEASLERLERNLMSRKTDRVSLVLANGQTVHVRRSDGWRTHHGRSRPAGLGPDEIVEFRQYGYHGSAPWLPARFVPWAKATRNHARVTHWRRAK